MGVILEVKSSIQEKYSKLKYYCSAAAYYRCNAAAVMLQCRCKTTTAMLLHTSSAVLLQHSGFPQTFENWIQGLFKDFQGQKQQFSRIFFKVRPPLPPLLAVRSSHKILYCHNITFYKLTTIMSVYKSCLQYTLANGIADFE